VSGPSFREWLRCPGLVFGAVRSQWTLQNLKASCAGLTDSQAVVQQTTRFVLFVLGWADVSLIRVGLSHSSRRAEVDMVISPDGRTILGQPLTGEIISWDIATGAKTYRTNSFGATRVLALSPDGHSLATTSDFNPIRVLDATTFRGTGTLAGHTDGVTGLAFSPDSHTLASSSNDNTIKLWDTATSQEIATLTGHTDVVLNLAFSPDGRTLISTSRDKTLRIWNTHVDTVMHDICGVLRGRVTAEQWQQLIPDLPFAPTCR
jgi:WD40 repeat protein